VAFELQVQSSSSDGCVTTLFFLKDTATHCGLHEKMRRRENAIYHDQGGSFVSHHVQGKGIIKGQFSPERCWILAGFEL